MAERRNFAKLTELIGGSRVAAEIIKKPQNQRDLTPSGTRPADCSLMFAYSNRVLHASVNTEKSKIKASFFLFFFFCFVLFYPTYEKLKSSRGTEPSACGFSFLKYRL